MKHELGYFMYDEKVLAASLHSLEINCLDIARSSNTFTPVVRFALVLYLISAKLN